MTERLQNFIAACVAWVELLTPALFCAYAFGPVIWEMVK